MHRIMMLALLVALGGCDRTAPREAKGPEDRAAQAAAEDEDSGQARAEAAGRALIGRPAPVATLTTIDGETIDLAKLYGKKPVYLKFWATWCVPCREQMPHFEQTYEALGDDVSVIAVNSGFNDTIDAVKAYRSRHGLGMPIVIDDGRLAGALNLRVTPQHVVIGRDGRIQYVAHLADAKLDQALRHASRRDGGREPEGAMTATVRVHRVGDRLSRLSVATIGGAPFDIGASGHGRPTALVFLSPWCESYLVESQPASSHACRRVREQGEALARRGDARWLGIASGLWATEKDLGDYRREHRISIPLTLDTTGDLFRAFAVTQVPTVIILDADGRIIRRLESDDADIEGALHAARGKAA